MELTKKVEVTYQCLDQHQWKKVYEMEITHSPICAVTSTDVCSVCGKLGKSICWGYSLK